MEASRRVLVGHIGVASVPEEQQYSRSIAGVHGQMKRCVPPKEGCLLCVCPSLQELLKSIPVSVRASFMNRLCRRVPHRETQDDESRTSSGYISG